MIMKYVVIFLVAGLTTAINFRAVKKTRHIYNRQSVSYTNEICTDMWPKCQQTLLVENKMSGMCSITDFSHHCQKSCGVCSASTTTKTASTKTTVATTTTVTTTTPATTTTTTTMAAITQPCIDDPRLACDLEACSSDLAIFCQVTCNTCP